MTKLTTAQGLEIYYKMKNGIHKVYLVDEYKVSTKTLYDIENLANRWKCLAPLINKGINKVNLGDEYKITSKTLYEIENLINRWKMFNSTLI